MRSHASWMISSSCSADDIVRWASLNLPDMSWSDFAICAHCRARLAAPVTIEITETGSITRQSRAQAVMKTAVWIFREVPSIWLLVDEDQEAPKKNCDLSPAESEPCCAACKLTNSMMCGFALWLTRRFVVCKTVVAAGLGFFEVSSDLNFNVN